MTPPRQGPDDEAAPKVHVADTVIAKIAAYYTRKVPGVFALQPDLTQTVLGFAGWMLGSHQDGDSALSTDGVDVDVDGQTAQIQISLITRLGYNCRDIAEAIQQQVTGQVATHTGLIATVSVTITDIDLGTGERHGRAPLNLDMSPGD